MYWEVEGSFETARTKALGSESGCLGRRMTRKKREKNKRGDIFSFFLVCGGGRE